MAARRRKRAAPSETPERGIRGAPLEPIRYVERELTRPDGTRLRVQVPVYPPFRLESQAEGRTERKPPARRRPQGRRKKSETGS